MKYELRASASLHSEWLVDDEGQFEEMITESDCHTLDGYFILQIDEDGDESTVFETNDFSVAKEKLAKLIK